jgi:predicted lipopolysaccharide heptosyltransferase III
MHILLIRLRLVGDVVFTTPALRALRRRFPDARLAYLVEPAAAPVVLGNPHLDEVFIAARSGGLQRIADDLRLAAALRRRRFDLVIDFHGGPRASWLAWASGAPRRIGYTIAGRSWMYTECVPRTRKLRARHSVENQWELLERLDVAPPTRETDPTEMSEGPEARRAVEARLKEAGVSHGDEVVVIHVSAGNPFRRWPMDAFATLAAAIASGGPRRKIVLTSGPSEPEAAARVADQARAQAPAVAEKILRCGEFDLPQLRALVGRAALFIGGDSGPLHIASTTATPIVALFGPTLADRSAPWRPVHLVTECVEPGPLSCRPCDQRVCAPGDFRCLQHTGPDRVHEAAERALRRGRVHLAPVPAIVQ